MQRLIAAALAAFSLSAMPAIALAAPACVSLQQIAMRAMSDNPGKHFKLIIGSPNEAAKLIPYLAIRAGQQDLKGDDIAALEDVSDPGTWFTMVLYRGCVKLGLPISTDDILSVLRPTLDQSPKQP